MMGRGRKRKHRRSHNNQHSKRPKRIISRVRKQNKKIKPRTKKCVIFKAESRNTAAIKRYIFS